MRMIENEDVVAAGEVVALRRAKRIAADKAVAAARKFFGATCYTVPVFDRHAFWCGCA